MNNAATDYQKVLTEVLQKQIIILGPAITLTKARNVPGINIDNTGRVISLEGDGHAISVKVLEQFRELSPLLVKKTMAPLLNAILYSQGQKAPLPTPTAPAPSPAPSDNNHAQQKHEEQSHQTV